MDLWRPCDAVETAAAWGSALENRDGPTCLILTRQALTHEQRSAEQVASIRRGGYVLIDSDGPPQVIVIATGSEVGIAAEAVRTVAAQGTKVRLVSMPSTTTFERQDDAYQRSVLPPSVTRRVAVEAGSTDSWWRYVGLGGEVVGIDHFGASSPAKELFKAYGFTAQHVIESIGKVSAR
jgi:transketolase